jgi:hypothetical protein
MGTRRTNPTARSKRAPASPGKANRIVRRLAQSTLLAAGMIATQMGGIEMDSRFQLFNPTLVDRLQAPITRHHE